MHAAAIFVVVLVGTAGPVMTQTSKPAGERVKVDTKRIAALVKGLADDKEASRKACESELLLLGKRTLPFLLKELKAAIPEAKDDEAKEAFASTILQLLQRMGPDAAAITRALLDAFPKMTDKNAYATLQSLATITPIGTRLTDGDIARLKAETVRRLVARRGMRARRLRYPETPSNWSWTINLMARRNQIDPDTPTHQFALRIRMRRRDDRVVICHYLAQRGAVAKDALDALRASLNAEMRYAWRTAKQKGTSFKEQMPRDAFLQALADAMIAIGPKDPQTAIAWGYRINFDVDPQRRVHGVHELMRLGPKAEKAMMWLLIALSRKDERVKADVITMLGLLGPAAKEAIPRLERLAAGKDKGLAVRAKAALAQIRKMR